MYNNFTPWASPADQETHDSGYGEGESESLEIRQTEAQTGNFDNTDCLMKNAPADRVLEDIGSQFDVPQNTFVKSSEKPKGRAYQACVCEPSPSYGYRIRR